MGLVNMRPKGGEVAMRNGSFRPKTIHTPLNRDTQERKSIPEFLPIEVFREYISPHLRGGAVHELRAKLEVGFIVVVGTKEFVEKSNVYASSAADVPQRW